MRRLGWGAVVLGLLAVWSAAPLVVLALRAASRHEWFSGADATTMIDELQYLSWIRDASAHFLASNLFKIGPSRHVFADPMFLVSAGLVRAGLSASLAYLVWLPVAAAALALGPYAFARERLAGRGDAAAAAVVTGIFFIGPLFLIAHWTDALSASRDNTLRQAATTLFPGAMLLGGLPFAIAIGLVPLALHFVERKRVVAAAAAALLTAWIHPWQGEQVALACLGAFLLHRRRDLVVPVAAAALPLVYLALLSHYDYDWEVARRQASALDVHAWAWLVAVAPLAALAAFGVRDPRTSVGEALLLAWPAGCVLAFIVTPSVPSHALIGISIPLSVLAVRGWLRLGWPRLAGGVTVAALVIGASIHSADGLRRTVTSGLQPYSIPRADRAALSFLAHDPQPGGVLARTYAGSLVPGLTGRQTWVGHASWSPGFRERSRIAERLMNASPPAAKAGAFVRATGARFVYADCGAHSPVERTLAPLTAEVHRFGCARVLALKPAR